MILQQALAHARELLSAYSGNTEPALESEVLLRHILGITRAQLYLELKKELALDKAGQFFQLIERRLQGEPLAYIIQCREFFGLDFFVDKRVLIPRPDTELLVEEALDYARKHAVSTIADIGTGSGAIAISLALNLPGIKILATDISAAALEVALINCQKYNLLGQITLLQGNLLNPLPGPVPMIVANLPYVPSEEVKKMPSAGYEPVSALDGGEEGLDWIFQLGRQIEKKLEPQGCLLLEISAGQSEPVARFFRDLYSSARIELKKDLAGIERVVKVIL